MLVDYLLQNLNGNPDNVFIATYINFSETF